MAYNDDRRKMMATQPVGKLLWQFAVPSIVSMLVTSVYNLCDTIFIGHTEGALAIAGLAIVLPLMNISTAFRLLAGVGGAAQTSMAMGRNDQEGAKLIYGNLIKLTVYISVALMVIGLLFLNPILTAFGASEGTLPYAHTYTFIYLLGLPLGHLLFNMTAQMRSIGNPKKAMNILVGTVLLNIVLDAIFIIGFGWGIAGAAWATVISQGIGMLQCVVYFRTRDCYLHLSRKGLQLHKDIVKRIFSIGVSPFSVQLSGCLIVVFINRSLMEAGGADGDLCVGAYGIMYRVSQIMILIVSGFTQAMQPLVGFNVGAGLTKRVLEIIRTSLAFATVTMTLGYIIILLWAEELTSILTTDAHLIAISGPAMRIALCVYPLVGAQMVATTYFNSVGKAKLSMFTSLSRMWLFLLPLLFILPQFAGINGVWWSMSIADCISVLLACGLLWYEMRDLHHS
ncbi:MAG: MATE family efflux transporter [Bacteroidales bacterium]|nr:MATE family efflux transporter [Bacteroidales bacterium]